MENKEVQRKVWANYPLVAFMFAKMLVPIHWERKYSRMGKGQLSFRCVEFKLLKVDRSRGNAQLRVGYIQIWSSGESQSHPTVNDFRSFAFLVRASSLENEVSFFSCLSVFWEVREFIDGTCYV